MRCFRKLAYCAKRQTIPTLASAKHALTTFLGIQQHPAHNADYIATKVSDVAHVLQPALTLIQPKPCLTTNSQSTSCCSITNTGIRFQSRKVLPA